MKEKINRSISIAAALFTMLIGILVIIGWYTHNDFLKYIINIPGAVKMKFNVALGFIFSSVVVLLYYLKSRNKIWHGISVTLCVLVFLIGLLTLAEYIFGINIGLDEFFIRDELPTTAIYYAGRMSPLSAINFILIGTGLFFLNKKRAALYQFIYLTAIIFVSVVMLIGINFITDIPTYIRLAVHVSIGFITICIAIYYAQPVLQSKISFQQKLITGFIAAILLMGIISSLFSFYTNKFTQASKQVELTKNILQEAEQTLSLTKDIESGSRGYIITHDSVYLKYFIIGNDSIYSHLSILKKLTENDLMQQERIDSLTSFVDKRINFSLQCIQLRNKKGFEAAYQLMATREGIFLTDKIRNLIVAIQQQENSLLDQRQKTNAKSNADFNKAFYTLLTGVFVLFGMVFFTVRHNLAAKIKAEKDAKENEAQIQKIFKAAPDAVIAINDKGVIQRWNTKAEMLFEWKAEEVIGKLLSETIIPHRYREAHQKGMNHFLSTGEGPVLTKSIEIQAIRKDNEEFDIALSISPIIFKNKYIFIGFIRDITEQKKAEQELQESEEKFSMIFETSPVGISIGSLPSGIYINANKSFLEMFGFRNEEVIGHTSAELNMIANDEREKIRQDLIQTGMIRDRETIVRKKSGKEFSALISIDRFMIKDEQYAITIAYDISERKRSEEQIRQLNTDLEKNVRQLEVSNKELEAFSYSVSHDLRAPLRAVNGYAKILEEDYNTLDNEAKRMLTAIQSNAIKMGNLIDDLLAFSRLGRKDLQKTTVNMQSIVENVVTDLNKALARLPKIKIGKLEDAMADKALISQVFTNLISNAVKYSSKSPDPVIEIKSLLNNGELIYSVKDNGVGFDMQYAHKLFGVFQRLHDMHEFEGTGVGLAIVERIINKHGGSVWAEAKPGEGATFFFSLPINK